MKLLALPFCLFDRHSRDPHSVHWDDGLYNYAGICQGCGKPIRRLRKGRWTALDTNRFDEPSGQYS